MARLVHQPREDQEFDFILGMAPGAVLACFIGTWPKAVEACRAMDVLVAEAAQEFGARLTVVRTDMTRCPEATKRHEVTGAPTVVVVRDGRTVASHAGPMAREELKAFLDAHV
ncbi:thioredoxin domain-containing protein [Streptomyces sp. NPDC051000]|uniref:thioredoxin family protein n=1 Tax=unclassified Streptomyces TaxID=2593676 RepID=UPI0033E862F3